MSRLFLSRNIEDGNGRAGGGGNSGLLGIHPEQNRRDNVCECRVISVVRDHGLINISCLRRGAGGARRARAGAMGRALELRRAAAGGALPAAGAGEILMRS
jgi:hypothetical protein